MSLNLIYRSNLKINKYERAKSITPTQKKSRKYSDSFNESFKFYLDCYRKIGLDFSGTYNPIIKNDINGDSCKEIFKKFENGEFKFKEILTKHPNIVFGVIKGKKSWGLHVKMWSEGISEGSFRKIEVLEEFYEKNVIIPDSFMREFNESVIRHTKKYLDNYRINK